MASIKFHTEGCAKGMPDGSVVVERGGLVPQSRQGGMQASLIRYIGSGKTVRKN